MTHLERLISGVVVLVVSTLLAAVPVHAQVSCDTLPNTIVVSGSTDFEPTLKEFAVRLAAESQPATIVSVALSSQATSCAAIKGLVDATDFGGLPGRYYTKSGTTIVANPCILPAGRSVDVVISDVFYESCGNVPQPRPADVTDALGPVEAAVFVVPKENTMIQYVTHEEAQSIYGCGVSMTRMVAGYFYNPLGVFCHDPSTGMQSIVAQNLGFSDPATSTRNCVRKANDGTLIFDLIPRPAPPCEPMTSACSPPPAAIGLVSVAALDSDRDTIRPIAFRAPGQTQAFYPDSGPAVADRKNVRDGHYPLWGYVHLIAKTTGGSLSPRSSDLIGWIRGTKTSPNIDSFALEVGAGYVPQCGMKVKRSSDGGLLSRYSPTQPCTCAAEALLSRSIPTGCTPCASPSACTGGKSCQHGFCD